MRWLFGFSCVVAVAVLGCSGTNGESDLCEGVECTDDGNPCTNDVCNPEDGVCGVPFADGTDCSDGACLDGTCTALTAVSGTVTIYDVNDVSSPAARATVSVVGTSLSTTTNDSGEFIFEVFEGDWFFQSEKEGLGGVIELETVPPGIDGLALSLFTDAVGAELERELGIEIDEAKGVISVNFGMAPGAPLGGETAELSESYEHSSATNANGDEVLSEALFEGGGPDLTFWNVDPTEELVVTPKGAEGVSECRLKSPGIVYPIRAGFATLRADAQCTPAP